MPKPENRTVVLVNNPRPAAPLQRPMTPILPETLTPTLAPIHHPGSVLQGSPTLPVSVSLPVPPSPVTMSIPVPPSARQQAPTLVPPLSQNNTAAALLHTQASAPQGKAWTIPEPSGEEDAYAGFSVKPKSLFSAGREKEFLTV